jgi:hypothetical protein
MLDARGKQVCARLARCGSAWRRSRGALGGGNMAHHRSALVPALFLALASSTCLADGGLQDATRVSGILGGGPGDLLLFVYASPRALFITIEDFSPDRPVKVVHSFEVTPAKANPFFLGAVDCLVDGRKISGLVAETKYSRTSFYLRVRRAWIVHFDPMALEPIKASRVKCENPEIAIT